MLLGKIGAQCAIQAGSAARLARSWPPTLYVDADDGDDDDVVVVVAAAVADGDAKLPTTSA